jgi:predicted RNA-binding Zn-ribbon protein involved in translation (DUF1610 family)
MSRSDGRRLVAPGVPQYNMDMNPCRHKNLVLLAESKDRIRCRHCHLTIKSDELTTRYCPECYEATGSKRYDFEEILEPENPTVQYRCEDCGLLIPVK